MSAKLTKEIVNNQLENNGRSVRLSGDYTNDGTKSLFECLICDNKWMNSPNNIKNGKGCPRCNDIRLSKDIINERLQKSGRDIRQIGDYNGARTKAEFQCGCGYKWLSTPDNIIRGSGCPSCYGKLPLSKDIVNERLSNAGRGIELIGDYTNNSTKTEFECKCGYEWSASPSNIMRGRGCPVCAEHGYNAGKPGWLYILIFNGYIKYGITNDLDQRLRKHLRNGQYTVALSKLYDDGSVAQNWERNIRIIFGGRFVTPEIMPDGWTETLCVSKLEALLDTVG